PARNASKFSRQNLPNSRPFRSGRPVVRLSAAGEGLSTDWGQYPQEGNREIRELFLAVYENCMKTWCYVWIIAEKRPRAPRTVLSV
ncbi:hypothetical protein, partial [Chachezhania antarctica]|uniref:hypothetical protein n=1 Tax=Chachezhania antarctica TaxID=2340860 RepID=UPI0019696A99